MKINIQAPWEVNDYTKDQITSKVEKLTNYFDRLQSADVFMKIKDKEAPEDKLIEIRLRMPGPEMFARANSDTFEKAVALVSEKLRKQLIKKKELLKSKR